MKGDITMSEISRYEAQVKRLQGLCEEHDLVYRFDKYRYPMAFVVRPTQGAAEQLSMLAEAEDEGYISPDAYMEWVFADNELKQTVDGGAFTISVTLRTKLETVMKKMIAFWLQFFFRDIIEKDSLRRGMMPVIDEGECSEADEEYDDCEDDEDDNGEEDVDGETEDEALLSEAAQILRMENKATVSLLQRRLKLGYSRAARVMDALEERGVVGPFNGSEPREVLPFDVPEDK